MGIKYEKKKKLKDLVKMNGDVIVIFRGRNVSYDQEY